MKLAILCIIGITAFEQAKGFNYSTARIADIHSGIRQGHVTCREIVLGYLRRIDAYGKSSPTTTGAIATTNIAALEEADKLDQFFQQNNRLKGRLHCVPLVAKDSIDVAGLPTTNGLSAFRAQIPQKDATVVKNCRAQGAIFIAKANMSPLSDKEAWGHSETGGLIRNPWALNYTTYGSSGGNGAAAAAMLAIGGIGTETGVSINLPSSANGIVGFRPPVELLRSYNGLEGVMPNSQFQDVVGPMARLAEDAIAIFDGMIGRPGFYSSSVLDPSGLNGTKINVFGLLAYESFTIAPGMDYSVDPKIKSLFSTAVQNMVASGAIVRNATFNPANGIQAVLGMFGASYTSCLPDWRNVYLNDSARFNDTMYRSFDQVFAARRLPQYYQGLWEEIARSSGQSGLCAQETRTFQQQVDYLKNTVINSLVSEADIVIWPALPAFPAKLGQDAIDKDWSSPTQSPINLVLLASWTGYPSITIPLGFSDPLPDAPQGLPIGLFMMSTPDKFPQLLKTAYAYQENFGILKIPKSFGGGSNENLKSGSSANSLLSVSNFLSLFSSLSSI